MNPFDLTGPSFLVFYWTLSVLCLLLIYWLRLRSDVTGAPKQMSRDACVLAYLRGGYPEVVRVALLTLVDEGVVVVRDRDLSPAPEATRSAVRPRRTALEKELLAFLAAGPRPSIRSSTATSATPRPSGTG